MQVNVTLDFERIEPEGDERMVERTRPSDRMPEESFQKPVF